MRVALSTALLLAAASSRGGCGGGATPSAPYDPCGGKTCGETCTACAPGDPNCAAGTVLMACDPSHRCVPRVDGMCGAAAACAGKACGDACAGGCGGSSGALCPAYQGLCDASGVCQQLGLPEPTTCVPPPPPVSSCVGQACGVPCVAPCPPGIGCPLVIGTCDGSVLCDARERTILDCRGVSGAPSWGCAGKGCGDACGYCPPGVDPSQCPVATLEPTACDGWLQCVNAGTFSCP